MITIDSRKTEKDGKVHVRFSMPPLECCDTLYLVGWFSEWDESVYRMQRDPDGTWSLTMDLEPGCEYQYAYRLPDGHWLEDPAIPPKGDEAGPKRSFVISSAALGA